jgi:hypothetical protein
MHLPSLLATEPKATRFSSDAWMAKEQAIPEEGERKAFMENKATSRGVVVVVVVVG